MDEAPEDLQDMNAWKLNEELAKAEARLKDLNEAAELAFKVIKEKETAILDEISAMRNEIKKRSGPG